MDDATYQRYYAHFISWLAYNRPVDAFMFQSGNMSVKELAPFVQEWASDDWNKNNEKTDD